MTTLEQLKAAGWTITEDDNHIFRMARQHGDTIALLEVYWQPDNGHWYTADLMVYDGDPHGGVGLAEVNGGGVTEDALAKLLAAPLWSVTVGAFCGVFPPLAPSASGA